MLFQFHTNPPGQEGAVARLPHKIVFPSNPASRWALSRQCFLAAPLPESSFAVSRCLLSGGPVSGFQTRKPDSFKAPERDGKFQRRTFSQGSLRSKRIRTLRLLLPMRCRARVSRVTRVQSLFLLRLLFKVLLGRLRSILPAGWRYRWSRSSLSSSGIWQSSVLGRGPVRTRRSESCICIPKGWIEVLQPCFLHTGPNHPRAEK